MVGDSRSDDVQIDMVAWIDRLRRERDREQARVDGLAAELAASRSRLAEVRALERQRLVREITATTRRDLNAIREQLWRLQELLTAGLSVRAASRLLAEVEGALDDLLDGFRNTVRGIFPAMLPERGPRRSLEELAATLPRQVSFDGDLGRRVDWQVESGLYHAVSDVLHQTASRDSDTAARVVFGRDGALQARVTAPGADVDALRTALADTAARLGVLGGAMTWVESSQAAVIDIRLPERPVVSDLDAAAPRYAHELYRQVWQLVRIGRRAAGTEHGRKSWDAVAERLRRRPRVAVLLDSEDERGPAARSTSAVDIVEIRYGPPDAELAADLAGDGPRGAIDILVCRAPASPAFRTALRSARPRIAFCGSGDVAAIVAFVARHAPVFSARRALVGVRALAPSLPAGSEVRRELDRILAEGHEVAELELLAELEVEHARVFADGESTAAATRLLGVAGTGMRDRLGLTVDSSDDEARAAAWQAARWWTARANLPVTGGRERAACDVLARTAERLVGQID